MKCPRCQSKVELKKYISKNPQGFLCSGCSARLIVDQSNSTIRYLVYLTLFLVFKYLLDPGLFGFLGFFVLVILIDLNFAAKVEILQNDEHS